MRPAHLGTVRLQGQTVLLVDEEGPLLEAMAAMLRLAGCDTRLATTGHDALAICGRPFNRLAAVILELRLPGEDPAALVSALRAHRPELPIILMSGLSEAVARERLGHSDIAGFLAKPFQVEQLLKTVERALDGLPAPSDLPASPPESAESRAPAEPPGVSGDAFPAPEPFERWFPRRVAEAVRRGELPEAVLERLRAMLKADGDPTAELPRLTAVCEITDLAGIPSAQAAAIFESLQQLPDMAQERLARRLTEAWLERQRSQYKAEGSGG